MIDNALRLENDVPASEGLSGIKRLSWASILAGVVVVLVVQLALSLLGIGLGASTIDPMVERNPTQGMGTGSSIWLVLSTLFSLFAGGWVAGRESGMLKRLDGLMHGILTWGLATLLTFYFLSSAVGGLLSGTANLLGKGVTALGEGAAAFAPKVADVMGNQLKAQGIDLNSIKQEAQQFLLQTGNPELKPENLKTQGEETAQTGAANIAGNPAVASQELMSLIDSLFSKDQATLAAADRETLITALLARTKMNREEASATVDRWQTNVQAAQAQIAQARVSAEATTREVADTAASTISKAAIWSFVALVLGAFAAAYGGSLGSTSNLKPSFTEPRTSVPSGRPIFHS